jgi:hypothetical protein
MAMLDVYAELLAAGNDPSERFPGIHAHLLACGPCAQDLEGLLPALTGSASLGLACCRPNGLDHRVR